MTRYVISGTLGASDRFQPVIGADEALSTIDLLDVNRRMRFGIERVLGKLAALGSPATPVAVDLMTVAALVYGADTRINRVQASQDAWTREIKLIVPVSAPALWIAAQPLLMQMLRFLTGDLWDLEFRPFEKLARQYPSVPSLKGTARSFDCVSLFSGGLDSLIGAIDILKKGEQTPLFVSHGGEGAVSGPQGKLFRKLTKSFSKASPLARIRLGMTFPNGLVGELKGEDSTRGRSFLFLALGSAAGSGFGKPFNLRVPENGLISLNVPLDVTRLGSNSTRTTHPFYIHRWNELLLKLGIPATVVNPYWDKTKGEMVVECADEGVLEELAPLSISCAHPAGDRWKGGGKAHCGYCLPCIIRRASFLKAPWPDKDRTGYRIENLAAEPRDTKVAEGKQIRSFQYALARLKANPELAKSWIYKPGPLREDALIVPDLVGVYERGMAEVRQVVDNVITFSSDGQRD